MLGTIYCSRSAAPTRAARCSAAPPRPGVDPRRLLCWLGCSSAWLAQRGGHVAAARRNRRGGARGWEAQPDSCRTRTGGECFKFEDGNSAAEIACRH
eukprot:6183377-Pleurochrysis_carterae.AAC.5